MKEIRLLSLLLSLLMVLVMITGVALSTSGKHSNEVRYCDLDEVLILDSSNIGDTDLEDNHSLAHAHRSGPDTESIEGSLSVKNRIDRIQSDNNDDSEEFLPLLEEDKYWIVENRNVPWGEYTFYTKYYIAGDTIIDNRLAKKIEFERLSDLEIPHVGTLVEEECAIYEENGVVYIHNLYPESQFEPYINFNVKVGESAFPPDYSASFSCEVTDIRIINLHNIDRKVVTADPRGRWVEGIGFLNMYTLQRYWVALTEYGSWLPNLYSCFKGDECLFSIEDLDFVCGQNELNVQPEVENDMLYDLFGNKVDRPQKGNIYIQNHRKIIWQ